MYLEGGRHLCVNLDSLFKVYHKKPPNATHK